MFQVGENLIINADNPDDINQIKETDLVAITCGLKLNSTITASSISDDGFTFCLQRSIYTLDMKEIPPQEFNIKWRSKPDDIYTALALVTILIICGTDTDIFKQIRF